MCTLQVWTQHCGRGIPRGSGELGYFRDIGGGYRGEGAAWGTWCRRGAPEVDALTCSCVSWLGRQGGVSGFLPLPGPAPRPHCVQVAPPGNQTDRPTWLRPSPPPPLPSPASPPWSPWLWQASCRPCHRPELCPHPSPGFNTPIPEMDRYADKKQVREKRNQA